MQEHSSIQQSMQERIEHMVSAILWFKAELTDNQVFVRNIELLLEHFWEADQEFGRKQIHFFGVGKSGIVAQLAASMLLSVGVSARFVHPVEALHGDLGAVRNSDTCVLISRSGATEELIRLVPLLRARSCTLFLISAQHNSELCRLVDYILFIPPYPEACPFQQAPITSTVTTTLLLQLLVAASVEHRKFALENYVKNHPGGTIGKQISLRVADVMQKGENLPLIQAEALFPECVQMLTKYAMSVVLVADSDKTKLLGVVSERDVRVAMEQYREKCFTLAVKDFMNKTPIVISSQVLAVDALRIMKNRDKPLNFLPVVDDGKLKGLLRLHDLVRMGL